MSHHGLLHYENRQGNVAGNDELENVGEKADGSDPDVFGNGGGTEGSSSGNMGFQVSSLFLGNGEVVEGEVLLSTALIQVRDKNGKWVGCRVLLDSGSQPNLITEDLVKKLGIPKRKVEVSILGVGNCESRIGESCVTKIRSNHRKFESTVSCLVVETISNVTPSKKLSVSHLDIPKTLQLADPSFNIPGEIELLLGANSFYGLLCVGQIRLGEYQPILQKTKLRWLVTGSLVESSGKGLMSLHVSWADVKDQLKDFWKIEEVPTETQGFSVEEEISEKLFKETTVRGPDGKFIVRIPLVDAETRLGDSKEIAVKRFLALERKLCINSKLRELYVDFMKEYKDLEHMSLVESQGEHGISYYMPHHGVLNEGSETTKLRVVFDGSAKSDSGVSFNDIQCNGPKLQEDLFGILIRFRQHQVVVCGDVAKMYRMVWVAPDQRNLQKIIWRFSPEDELAEWTLNTVTYGTKSAPYLAVKCLRQLGLDNADKFPEASKIVLGDFFVDDLLTGAESFESAIKRCREVSEILKSGGMILRKWLSNDSAVQRSLSDDDESLLQLEKEKIRRWVSGGNSGKITSGFQSIFREIVQGFPKE